MTPKEKAIELFDKFYIEVLDRDGTSTMNELEAKQCALLLVYEIIKILPQSEYLEDRLEMVENRELIYWKEVKLEIEKL
jgi:hypothetical protein